MPVRNNLPRTASLKKRTEIDSLLSGGSRLSGSLLAIRWKRAERFSHAVLVGRKHGNAVKRNRIKRRMREALRLSGIQHQSVSLLVMPRPLTSEPSFEKLTGELNRLVAAIG